MLFEEEYNHYHYLIQNLIVFMKSKKAIITTSWDDGDPLDKKLSKLLLKYSIPGTFYIPVKNGNNKLLTNENIQDLSKNFEIGGHTLNHTPLTALSEDVAKDEIMIGKEKLEEICGEIVSFAYPQGKYNDAVTQIVKKAGFRGARTAEFLRTTIDDPFVYHPTVHAYNRILLSKGKQLIFSADRSFSSSLMFSGTFFKTWDIIAKKSLDYVLSNGGIWHLWGQSWEIDENNHWELLDDVLEYVKKKGKECKADFLTNGELFESIK